MDTIIAIILVLTFIQIFIYITKGVIELTVEAIMLVYDIISALIHKIKNRKKRSIR